MIFSSLKNQLKNFKIRTPMIQDFFLKLIVVFIVLKKKEYTKTICLNNYVIYMC